MGGLQQSRSEPGSLAATVTFIGEAAAKLQEACALTGMDIDTVLTSALVLYIITGDGSEYGVQRNLNTGVYLTWLVRQAAVMSADPESCAPPRIGA